MPSSLNGTGVTFSNGSTQSVAWPGNTGTVTSVATGNGLQGGTITTTGTLSVAAPSAGSVGSYAAGGVNNTGASGNFGSNYSTIYTVNSSGGGGGATRGGTWMCLGTTGGGIGWGCNSMWPQLWVRVA